MNINNKTLAINIQWWLNPIYSQFRLQQFDEHPICICNQPVIQHLFSIPSPCHLGRQDYYDNNNKKLSYRRGTAISAMLVNYAMFHEVWELETFQTAKVTSSHARALAMVPFDTIRFPISVPLQLCLYLAPFTRYYHLFPKI